MFKDLSSVLVIILVIVVGGLAYLLLPGRLNGPASSQTGTSTATSTITTIMATTTPSVQGTSTYEGYEPSAS
ncbi:MAG: hypothetical protein WC385_03770 [Candidatus Paceibacterota bacterium]|jgi:hypothetical protein